MALTKKQQEVAECFCVEKPKILICSGGKRAGKTYILTLLFIRHVAEFHGKGVDFIIGGATLSSIRRNILGDMEKLLNREIKLNKNNAFKLFGNNVYCFEGCNSDSYKKPRGFTSFGFFGNEATTLHDTFIKECISRCSGTGSRILLDTNPENPIHTVKVDYIDKSGQKLDNGRLNIKAFSFTLFDNNKLDSEYIESIVKSTPSGMFSDRDIYGKWVSAEGVVYTDFNQEKHVKPVKLIDGKLYVDGELCHVNRYIGGVDWGFEHHGVLSVVALLSDGRYVLVEEVAKQHKHIDYWVSEGKRIIEKYGQMVFYGDYARPEYLAKFNSEELTCLKANKSVIAGISEVAKLFKTDKIVISKECKRIQEEIYNYVWKTGKDEPVKVMDDSLDTLRYIIFTDKKHNTEW